MRAFTLSTGASLPAVGLGTAGKFKDEKDVINAVHVALRAGYRHIDTASLYGSEEAIGKALVEAFDTGLVTREDIFVTSKLWCDDHDPESVRSALEKSLRLLKLDYLDLYLMHFPVKLKKGASFPPKDDEFLPLDIKGTWRAMESCVDNGLTLAIGVSNFSVKQLSHLLLHAKRAPAVNQVEIHPLWQQLKLRTFCESVGIHVSAWSPLGAPGCSYGTYNVINNPVICSIARDHHKTPAQVCLRWGLQSGASVLPKSYRPERIKENLAVQEWELTQEDLQEISQLPQSRIVSCQFFSNCVSSPYRTIAELWD